MRTRPPKSLGPALAVIALLAGAVPVSAAGLRVALSADPAMIDPITYSELVADQVISNMYETLTTLDAKGETVPALAESWEPLPGNLGFRFHLRRGVKFHSGRPFTAADVKFSYEQLLLPGQKGGLNATYLDIVVGADKVKSGASTSLEGVRIVDDHTVEVVFTKPDVLFPIYPIYIMDSGIVASAGPRWFNTVSAGTGPYSLVEWKHGQEIRLAADPDYWGGRPAIADLRFLVIPSPETALAMYETDAVDVVPLNDDQIRQVMKDPKLKAQSIVEPRAQVRYLAMNEALYPPFRDKRVREAVCLSLDQQEMIEGLYGGAAIPLNGQIVEGVGGYDASLRPIPFDPKRAAALFVEAGHAGGAGMPPLGLTTTGPNKNQHLYFASQLADVLGWKVDVDIVERGTMLKMMNSSQVAFFAWGWTADYPDGLNFLQQLWHSGSPYNRGWKNPDFDALIDRAAATADDHARYELYHRAEKILMDDWATCPLPVTVQMTLVRKGLQGIGMNSKGLMPFAKARFVD
jgi:ABC-type transport system substrate-binding protein